MPNHILTDRQVLFLTTFGQEQNLAKNFYFTGGTPLAEWYLQHRLSEDLDFFAEAEFDVSAIQVFLKNNQTVLGFERVDFEQSYNRNLFFLHFADGEVLKTEFTYYPFPRIEVGEPHFSVATDSATDIAVNKLFTIYQRTKARDYIDLYFLCQKFNCTITDLIKKAKIKFDWHIDPIQLGTQFIKASEAPDLPKMIVPLDITVIQEFFTAEAKKLKDQILD